MRFNPKARLDTSRVRDVGRGGGGGGGGAGGGWGRSRVPIPGGAKAGGGIGAILVVLVLVVVSQLLDGGSGAPSASDPGQQQGTDRYEECASGADASESADCARVAVENSLYSYWSQALPDQGGTDFAPTTVTTFSDAVSTGCGQATAQVGPFYCPPDRGIYLDTTFFRDVLEGQLGGSGGDFVEPYVLAHEYGHHIQNLLGTMGRVRTQQGPRSDAVRLELQADCYAGMWAAAATDTTDTTGVGIFAELDRSDVDEALDSAKAVGDDRIQQRSGGRVDPDGWTHGSAEQRQRWFMVGFEQGTLEACDTFATDDL